MVTVFKKNWLWLSAIAVIIGGLFISSSMTYHQQSLIPQLKYYLAAHPAEAQLQQIDFHYGGQEQSLKTVGYFKLVEFFIRKAAHFMVFGLLGMFSFLFLKNELRHWPLAPWIAWFVVTGWAGFDEFHEMLTGGRTALVADVMLDSAGAFCFIVITVLIWRLWVSYHQKRQRKY